MRRLCLAFLLLLALAVPASAGTGAPGPVAPLSDEVKGLG